MKLTIALSSAPKTALLKNSESVYSTENQQNLSDLLKFFQYHSKNNQIDDEKAVVIRFSGFLESSASISDDLNQKNLSLLDSEISKFFTSLATNTNIKKLHINFNFRNSNASKIFDQVILFNKFVSGMKGNQTLEDIQIENLENADLKLFFDNLETTKIKKLLFYDLENCDFSKVESISNRIIELMFESCNSEYVHIIANVLKNNHEKNIQKFSIKNTYLGDQWVAKNENQFLMQMIDILYDYQNLKVLELDYCFLENDGLQKIAEMIKKKAEKNEFLEELSLMGNEFYDFEIFLEIWFRVKKFVRANLTDLIVTREKLKTLQEKYSEQEKQNPIWSQCTIINFDAFRFVGLTVNASKEAIRSFLITFPFTGDIKKDMKIASILFEGNTKNMIDVQYNLVMDKFVKLVVHNPIVIQSANKSRTQKLLDISDMRFKNRLSKGVNLMSASEKTYEFCEVGPTRSQNKVYTLNKKMALDALKTGLNPYTQIKIKPCNPDDPEIEYLIEKMIATVEINEGEDFLKDVEDRVQKTASFLEKNSLKRTSVEQEQSNEKASKKQKTALMVNEIQEKKKEILFNKNDCEKEIFDLSEEALRIFRMWKQDVFTMGKVFFYIPPHVSAEFARTRPCDSVVLYRGMSWREKTQLEDFLKSKTFEQNNRNGQKEVWITDVYKTFHSWTFDFFVAKNFAQYDGNRCGIIFESHFEPEDIVIDFTKLRSYNIMNSEKEILVRPMKVTCKIIEIIKDGIISYEDENMELVSFLKENTQYTIQAKMVTLMKKNFDPNTIVHNLPFYWHLMMKDWTVVLDIVSPRIDTTKNANYKNSSLIARLIDFLENESVYTCRMLISNIKKNFNKIYKTRESRRIVFQESGDDVHCWFLNQIYEKKYNFIFELFDTNMNKESVEDDAHASFWKKFLEPLKINILVNSPDLYEALNEYFEKLEEKPFNSMMYDIARAKLVSLQNEIGTENLGPNFETEFKKYFYYKSMDTILKTFVHEHFYLKEMRGNILEIRSSVEKNGYVAISLAPSLEYNLFLYIYCFDMRDQVKSIIFDRLTNKRYKILKKEYNFIVVKEFSKNENPQDKLILKLIANSQDQEKILTTSLYYCMSAIAAINFDQYKINPN
jgi:hypothetical protein